MCQAAGDPQPKIVWNKKGKKVSNQRFEVHHSFVSLHSSFNVMVIWMSAGPHNNLLFVERLSVDLKVVVSE